MSDSGEASVTVPGTVPQYDTSNSCPVVAQPQIVFVVDESYTPSTRRNISYKDVFPEKAILGLAISLILAGALSIIIKIVLINWGCETMEDGYCRTGIEMMGWGIWIGMFFTVAGSFGVVAAKNPSNCTIITCMVFTILASFLSIWHMIMDSIGTSESADNGGKKVAFLVLFLMGITAGIVSVILAGFTCQAVCCSKVRSEGAVFFQHKPTSDNSQTATTNNNGAFVVGQTQLATTHYGAASSAPPAYYETLDHLGLAEPTKVNLA